MRKDSCGYGYENRKHDNDAPKAKYACPVEVLVLNKLNDPDEIKPQHQAEVDQGHGYVLLLERHLHLTSLVVAGYK